MINGSHLIRLFCQCRRRTKLIVFMCEMGDFEPRGARGVEVVGKPFPLFDFQFLARNIRPYLL